MPIRKVLGQAAPAAATPADLYTVPGSYDTTTSTFMVANRSGTDDNFRMSVAVGGVATSNEQYVYYDEIVPGNGSFSSTIGMTLAAGDVVRVYTTNGTSSFNLFGVENEI